MHDLTMFHCLKCTDSPLLSQRWTRVTTALTSKIYSIGTYICIPTMSEKSFKMSWFPSQFQMYNTEIFFSKRHELHFLLYQWCPLVCFCIILILIWSLYLSNSQSLSMKMNSIGKDMKCSSCRQFRSYICNANIYIVSSGMEIWRFNFNCWHIYKYTAHHERSLTNHMRYNLPYQLLKHLHAYIVYMATKFVRWNQNEGDFDHTIFLRNCVDVSVLRLLYMVWPIWPQINKQQQYLHVNAIIIQNHCAQNMTFWCLTWRIKTEEQQQAKPKKTHNLKLTYVRVPWNNHFSCSGSNLKNIWCIIFTRRQQ